MGDEKKKSRRSSLTVAASLILGLTMLVIILMNTHILVVDIYDPETDSWPAPLVRSLLVSFEKRPFEKDEVLDVTGRFITRINITERNGGNLVLYSSQEDIHDVGFAGWKNGEILSFCSEPLVNGSRYVIQLGQLSYLTEHGSNSTKRCLSIEEIREVNWLDETIINNAPTAHSILVIMVVVALTLLIVPLLIPFLDAALEEYLAVNGNP